MSFLSGLGKALKFAAPVAASFIPGVGGVAGKLLGAAGGVGGALSQIGSTASNAAQGSASQRLAEAPAQIGAYNANVNSTLAQDRRAALASMLGGGLQDAVVNRPAGSTIPDFSVSGGLRPSAMNPSMLLAQLGKPIAPLEMPTAGLGEKILGGVGLGANFLGALGGIQKKPAATYLPSTPGVTGLPQVDSTSPLASWLPASMRYPYTTPPYRG